MAYTDSYFQQLSNVMLYDKTEHPTLLIYMISFILSY